MMCNTCRGVCGLLVLVAGILLLLAGLGNMMMESAIKWAGILIGLYGLGLLAHGMNMCPKCK
ncbi:MAG: hypothetical protein AABY07_03800 [Nanoarchaeota archaeon]